MDTVLDSTSFFTTAIVLTALCASLMFAFIPRPAHRHDRVSLYYFWAYFLCVCAAYVSATVQQFNGNLGFSIITELLFVLSAYCLLYGIRWRVRLSGHIFSHPLPGVHLGLVAMGLHFVNSYRPEAGNVLITLATSNAILIYLICLVQLLQYREAENTGFKLLFVALCTSVGGLFLVLLSYLYFQNPVLHQQNMLLLQLVSMVLYLGGIYSLYIFDLVRLYHDHSITDVMTGLRNRRYFLQHADSLLRAAERHHFPVSVILCDIDKFKNINDKYGHNIGDKAIVSFAKTLHGLVRESDVAARFGGEEFVILLPQTDITGAHKLAERMRSRTENLCVRADGHEVTFTASFGVSTITGKADLEQGIKTADDALYVAKQEGRNRVAIYQEGMDAKPETQPA